MIIVNDNYILEGEEEDIDRFVKSYTEMYLRTLQLDLSISSILNVLKAEDALDMAAEEFNISIKGMQNEYEPIPPE